MTSSVGAWTIKIPVNPKEAKFFYFKHCFFNSLVTLQKYHKNKHHFCLKWYIFTKLSQIVYLSNTHILIYWHDRSDCMFTHNWKLFMFEAKFFFIKHSQFVYLITDLFAFLVNFYIVKYLNTCLKCRPVRHYRIRKKKIKMFLRFYESPLRSWSQLYSLLGFNKLYPVIHWGKKN